MDGKPTSRPLVGDNEQQSDIIDLLAQGERLELAAARSIVFLIIGVALLVGCRSGATPISNSVTDEEYSVYSAWIKHHFKEQPPRLLLASRTFIFDPLNPITCGKAVEPRGDASSSLLRALHNLGEAEYPIRIGKFHLPAFRVPWNVEEWDRATNPYGPFRLIAFSRVAFNRDRSKALFAVSNSCGGLCGGGGALLAIREKGEWIFRSDLGCVWAY
jgi:hypothetical protein